MNETTSRHWTLIWINLVMMIVLKKCYRVHVIYRWVLVEVFSMWGTWSAAVTTWQPKSRDFLSAHFNFLCRLMSLLQCIIVFPVSRMKQRRKKWNNNIFSNVCRCAALFHEKEPARDLPLYFRWAHLCVYFFIHMWWEYYLDRYMRAAKRKKRESGREIDGDTVLWSMGLYRRATTAAASQLRREIQK